MLATRLVFYVKVLVASVIAGSGLFFIIYPEKFTLLQTRYTIIIGFIFLARGLFRGYTAYRDEFKRER